MMVSRQLWFNAMVILILFLFIKPDLCDILEQDPSHKFAAQALEELNYDSDQSDWDSDECLFPDFDEEDACPSDVSDSSDYNHVGNGKPCRHYNHHECKSASVKECEYSHAPDSGSVRDDL